MRSRSDWAWVGVLVAVIVVLAWIGLRAALAP